MTDKPKLNLESRIYYAIKEKLERFKDVITLSTCNGSCSLYGSCGYRKVDGKYCAKCEYTFENCARMLCPCCASDLVYYPRRGPRFA